MEYKFIELLSADFVQSPPELIRQQIMYRYATMKSRVTILHDRLQEVQQLVKLKNPSLLLQLQKTSVARAAATGQGGRNTSTLATTRS